ncbi:DUF2971 domain-containing protein [Terasakiella pusilla]|uniref:DUF2971 domain-containing protein n=1 Tax=Terasakiella pusilla TaxID=64973 RepID=UPI003AA8A85C
MKQFFKYMNEPRDFFKKGFVRLSQLNALNDPFEAVFCHKSLNELASHLDEPFCLAPGMGEVQFFDYINTMINRIGVISFTETKDSLLMWAHYANEHKGIVAGVAYDSSIGSIFYDLLSAHSLFSSSSPSWYSPFDGQPKPVSYKKGLRYRNDMFDYDYSDIYVQGGDRFLYEVFLQKSEEWIYEQEHRIVLRLEQADCVIVPKPYLCSIDNQKIKNTIQKASYTSLDDEHGSYVINLFKIEDEIERVSIAIELAKLGENPKVIYLMKLSSSAINHCIIGLNSELTKAHVQGDYALSTGYLDIWKAIKNVNYYGIEFEQISGGSKHT